MTPSIKTIATHSLSKKIDIFGAGKGGHKIAEQYHKYLPKSQYFLLLDADHEFSKQQDQESIFGLIKKRLDVIYDKPLRRRSHKV
ncbi:MAG: hypothetical protein PHZ25_01405 [Candidatus Pacebacteria bacterium]|nr:hypothetical protein [Candidatus Paceibacterota bacterium]